jgi:hypothetical protein
MPHPAGRRVRKMRVGAEDLRTALVGLFACRAYIE